MSAPAQRPDELFDVVNRRDEVIGQATRSSVHGQNLLHRAVHLWILNAAGEIFLQKRSMAKDTFPGCWGSAVSGHVDAGESYDEAVVREAAEEMGLRLREVPELIGRYGACRATGHEFVQVYAMRHEGPFHWPANEVSDGRWISANDLAVELASDREQYTTSFSYLWEQAESSLLRPFWGRSVFDAIRHRCAWVAEQAGSVQIDDNRRVALQNRLDVNALMAPSHDTTAHWLDHGEETLAFFFILDAINFGSGYFPHLDKLKGRSGYFTVATRLTERFAEVGPLTPDELSSLDAKACAKLFQQRTDNDVAMELMAKFAEALNQLGHLLVASYGGSFVRLRETAGDSAERLVRLLLEMRAFRDVWSYGGRPVPLLKRAQLTVADLSLAFHGQGWGRFADVDTLTLFADNLVPHVLRRHGVLVLKPDLAARIDAGDLLEPGSAEEVELRACAVEAVERMVHDFHRRGHNVNAMQVDMLLWNAGQDLAIKAHPRPRCRTMSY